VQIGLVDEHLPVFPVEEFGFEGIDEVDVVHEGGTQQSRGSGADVMFDPIHAEVVADRRPQEVLPRPFLCQRSDLLLNGRPGKKVVKVLGQHMDDSNGVHTDDLGRDFLVASALDSLHERVWLAVNGELFTEPVEDDLCGPNTLIVGKPLHFGMHFRRVQVPTVNASGFEVFDEFHAQSHSVQALEREHVAGRNILVDVEVEVDAHSGVTHGLDLDRVQALVEEEDDGFRVLGDQSFVFGEPDERGHGLPVADAAIGAKRERRVVVCFEKHAFEASGQNVAGLVGGSSFFAFQVLHAVRRPILHVGCWAFATRSGGGCTRNLPPIL